MRDNLVTAGRLGPAFPGVRGPAPTARRTGNHVDAPPSEAAAALTATPPLRGAPRLGGCVGNVEYLRVRVRLPGSHRALQGVCTAIYYLDWALRMIGQIASWHPQLCLDETVL